MDDTDYRRARRRCQSARPGHHASRRRIAGMAGDELKSAYELAMERLKKKDEEAGVQRREPTEAEKAAIAEIRRTYQAKVAEVELQYQSRARSMFDPAERATLDAE